MANAPVSHQTTARFGPAHRAARWNSWRRTPRPSGSPGAAVLRRGVSASLAADGKWFRRQESGGFSSLISAKLLANNWASASRADSASGPVTSMINRVPGAAPKVAMSKILLPSTRS